MFSIFRSGVKKLFGNKPKKRTFASIAYDKDRPLEINGFKKVDEDDDSVAYKDDKGNIKIGIRGTSNIDDVLTDIKLLGGKKIEDTERFKKADNFVKRINQKYGNNIDLETHSLSGMIGNKLANKYDFIKGGTSYNPFLTDKSQISSKIKNIRSPLDPVSIAVSKDIETDYSKLSGLNPIEAHSIDQF
jgi:hypothetical protein